MRLQRSKPLHCELYLGKIPVFLLRGNRKNCSAIVRIEGIYVRVPRQSAKERAAVYLQSHERALTEKYNRLSERNALMTALKKGESFLLFGREYPVIPDERSGFHGDSVRLNRLSPMKSAKALLLRYAKEYLPKRTTELAESLHLQMPNAVTVRFYRRRWGSYGSKGRFTLNACLAMLPNTLIDYVICHELCHIIQFNHSAAFWSAVESVCPAYKMRHEQLQEWGDLTRVYSSEKKRRNKICKRTASKVDDRRKTW